MRSGISCIQQALTIEATNILKLSLNLARRRGHAQVTPLHVATTLLTSSSSSSNLLRRACLKSQPFNISSHPLQTRALELCFNVALNRLPTIPVPNSLIHTQPSLSNALIAALKRAQAHQRRGCIEQQQQHFQQSHQNQSLLAIKVELEQLIISILDDPSVSRVMREAGFSSTSIKINLEEDSSSASAFFFDSNRDVISNATFFNTHFLKSSPEQNPSGYFAINEDLKVVYEILLRRFGRKNNVVLVGDSVTLLEGLMSEFVKRLEKGEVHNELKSTSFVKLHLSNVHMKLMSKIDVDMKVCDLRRKVMSLALEKRNNVIIFAGDLKWALDDEGRNGFSTCDYLIKEVGNLITELRIVSSCKVWLMATADYKSYMSCQMRHPSFETEWGIQAVMVPSGGLKLSLQQNQSEVDLRMTKLATTYHPLQMQESKSMNPKVKEDEDVRLICCTECRYNFEKEASAFNTELNQLPSWLQPHKLYNPNKDTLGELRMKWNKLCRNYHGHRYSSSDPWWSTLMPDSDRKFSNTNLNLNNHKARTSDVKTVLSLGNTTFSDTATSADQRSTSKINQKELCRKLHRNIPWQSENIPVILEALVNGSWLLLQGTDSIGKSRLARVLADTIFESPEKLICIDARVEAFVEALRKDKECVMLIKKVDKASTDFLKTISECIKTGILEDEFGMKIELSSCFFVLTGNDDHSPNEDDKKVLKMKLSVEEESSENRKRRNPVSNSTFIRKAKKKIELDLNISAEDSDLTHEMDDKNEVHLLSTVPRVVMNKVEDEFCQMEENIIAKLSSVIDKGLVVEETAVEGLKEAMGGYLESEFEKWLKEVVELSVVTVKNGGKVKLCVEGKEGNVAEFGFLGSVLPKRIHVD